MKIIASEPDSLRLDNFVILTRRQNAAITPITPRPTVARRPEAARAPRSRRRPARRARASGPREPGEHDLAAAPGAA